MNRSKRPSTPKSRVRLERQRLLNDDDIEQNIIWKSVKAETYHKEGEVRKRLGKVIGVRGKSEASYKTEQLKAELEEVCFSTRTIPTIWSPQEVEVFQDKEDGSEKLVLLSDLANGKSCFDLLNCKRESGQKQFYCEYMCPFLATKCLMRCLDALNQAASLVPSGYHGNIKPQNILLHFDPAKYMDSELTDLLRKTTLETYIPTTEEISLVCSVYLTDFDAPGQKTHRLKTKKQDLKESESFDELPHFSLARFESEVTGEERKYLLTHVRQNEETIKHHADDIWALASSVVTISTGVFILRDENRKRILSKKWTMDWEEQQMDEKVKHAWESLPAALRTVLKSMLVLDWKKRPKLSALCSNPFLEDYKDACRRAKDEYLELQVCCIEVSYHRWFAEQQILRLEESLPKNPELDLKVGEALREAAKSDDILTLREILHIYHGYSKVVDNCDNSLNRTPLMLAASRGNVECVKALIEHDANLMVRTKAHDTAVVFAIEHGHLEATRVLVEAMEDKRLVAANDRRWWTPLHFAVYHNCFKITKMLLESGIGGSPRTRDASGRIPEEYVGYKVTACDSHAFALEPKEQAIKDMLVKHKDTKIKQDPFRLQDEQENDHAADSNGGLFCEHEMTILDKFHNALHSRKLKAEALLESGLLRATVLPVNPEITSQMRLAAEQGAVDKLRQYLEKYGHNPNLVNHTDNGHGWTAAHVAAMRGRDSCLKLLYSYGASMVLPEKRGALPIHFAVVNGHYSTTKLLLELLAGTEIVIEPSSDDVLLRREVVAVLKKGYPLKNKSGSGWTVLHHAAAHDFVEIAQLLVKCGANPKWKDADGKSCSDLVHSTKMALLFEKHINKRHEARRRSSSIKGVQGETESILGESKKRSLGGAGSVRGRQSSMSRERAGSRDEGSGRGGGLQRSLSRDSVGSVEGLELNDLTSAAADNAVLSSTLPPPPVIDDRSPSPTMTRRRLSSSAYIVNLEEKEIIRNQTNASPQMTREQIESSPLSIDDAQPMLVTFADGHTEVTIERIDMSPVLHSHNLSISSTPHGVVPTEMPPSRSPSFSRRISAGKAKTAEAAERKKPIHDEQILKEKVVPTPPSHLESVASVERKRSSALATGKPIPLAAPPITPSTPTAKLQPMMEGNDGDETSTYVSSALSDGEDYWTDEDDEDENNEIVTNSIGGGKDVTRSGSPLRIDTNTPTPGSTPAPGGSDARVLFGDVSVTAKESVNDAPSRIDGQSTSRRKSRRKREKFHSLKSLDSLLTKQGGTATELQFKSDVARELFTITAVMLVTPAWQRNLLHAGHGEEEAKSEAGTFSEESRTVVSLQSLQDITQKFVSTRARSLISAIWEAADSGATDRLRTLLRQVGDGPKARHFNVVGGAEFFDINDLSQIDEKCVCSPLYAAAKKGHTECAHLLLDAGADPGFEDREGMTPLHVAAIWGRTAIIRLLVELGADIDARDIKGNTALHRACIKYVKQSIATLAELGCNVTLKNKAGKRADEASRYSASRTAILNGVKKRGY